jgi:glycosyltransferase involved in cell wall biosynthesis
VKAFVLRSTEVDPDPRAERAIRDLQKAGFRVELLFWNRTNRKISTNNEPFFRVSYNNLAPYGLGWKNLSAQVGWQFWLFRKIMSQSDCLIYACDADTALISSAFHRLRNHILVYDQFDQISSRFESRLMQKFSDLIDLYISARAEITVVAGEDRKFKTKSRLLVVSNNPDLPLSPTKLKTPGELKIAYCGVLQADRGLLELIDVINSVDNVRLTIAGFGPLQGTIEARVSSSVKFLGRLSPSEVIKEYERADVSYVAYDPTRANNRKAASSKLYESAISCTPCIVSKGTNLANVVEQFDVGWSLTYGNKEELRVLFQKLMISDQSLIVDFDEKRREFLKSHGSAHQHSNLVKYLTKLKEGLM